MNMNVRTNQGGFTLIELVIVIVLLGILAAVAVPRFLDLSEEAADAACDGVRGAVLAQAAINIADPDINGIGGKGSAQDVVDNIVSDATFDVTDDVVTATLPSEDVCPPIDLGTSGFDLVE